MYQPCSRLWGYIKGQKRWQFWPCRGHVLQGESEMNKKIYSRMGSD